MREIKLRAWDTVEKDWVQEWLYLPSLPINEAIKDIQKSSRIILMQYTGLKDKNGKEIYEGDILKNWQNKVAPVKFFVGIVSSEFHAMNPNVGDRGEPFYLLAPFEVVGNIYENPELLEGDE